MSGIQLRPFVTADAEWIHRACQDPEIQRWTLVPRPYGMEHARSFLADDSLEDWRWAIEESGAPLGVVSIHGVDPASGDAPIGYWVAPWARRRGVATAAVAGLIDAARSRPGIGRVVAHVARDNRQSRGVVERAGFQVVSEQFGPATIDLQPVLSVTYVLSLR